MHFDLFFLYNIGVLSFQQTPSWFFTLPYFCFCRLTFWLFSWFHRSTFRIYCNLERYLLVTVLKRFCFFFNCFLRFSQFYPCNLLNVRIIYIYLNHYLYLYFFLWLKVIGLVINVYLLISSLQFLFSI